MSSAEHPVVPSRADAPTDGRGGFTPASRVLITLAAATLTVAGLYFSKGVIAPLAVAALVVMVSHPVRHPLQRRGVPAPLATAAVIALAYLILIIMGVLLLVAVAQFVNLLPQYADQFTKPTDDLVPTCSSSGWTPAVLRRWSSRSTRSSCSVWPAR